MVVRSSVMSIAHGRSLDHCESEAPLSDMQKAGPPLQPLSLCASPLHTQAVRSTPAGAGAHAPNYHVLLCAQSPKGWALVPPVTTFSSTPAPAQMGCHLLLHVPSSCAPGCSWLPPPHSRPLLMCSREASGADTYG